MAIPPATRPTVDVPESGPSSRGQEEAFGVAMERSAAGRALGQLPIRSSGTTSATKSSTAPTMLSGESVTGQTVGNLPSSLQRLKQIGEQEEIPQYVKGTRIPKDKAREILAKDTYYHATWEPIDSSKPSEHGHIKQSILDHGFRPDKRDHEPAFVEREDLMDKIKTPEDLVRLHPMFSKYTPAKQAEMLSDPETRASLQSMIERTVNNPEGRRKTVEMLQSSRSDRVNNFFYDDKTKGIHLGKMRFSGAKQG